MKVPVSILLPIKNEAANLPRCLNAVAWADEIWVVDSASTDGSQAVVEAFSTKAEIEKTESRKEVAEQKPELRSPLSALRSPVTGTASGPGAETGNEQRAAGNEAKARHLTPTLSPIEAEREFPSVKLVQFHFNGTWPKKKNWALENLPFKHEWVFILDADEVLPPEAEAEIRAIVSPTTRPPDNRPRDQRSEVSSPVVSGQWSGADAPPVGYWINRRFMFMGKWLKHAYYPNWNLRLFKHRLGRYEKLTEVATASGDNEVHEHVVVNGRTGRLKCEMDHYAFPSVEVFIEKHNRYSNWEARVALDKFLQGSSQSLQNREVGTLRRLKQLSQRLPFRPLQRFLYVYLWQRGFLDGIEGWHFARLHAVYEYLCVVKTEELKKRQRSASGPEGPTPRREIGDRRSEDRDQKRGNEG